MKTIKYLLFLLPIFACSQVGINTDEPTAMLDVRGAIRVGTEDATPEEGTIRYQDGKLQVFTTRWETIVTEVTTPIFLNESQNNLQYGEHEQQVYDFYRGTENDKVLMFVHGGGWNVLHRQRDYYRNYLEQLVRENPTINVINMDYRLAYRGGDIWVFPDMIDDLNSVVEIAKSEFPNAEIIVVGNSAGGHLGMWHYWNFNTIDKVISIASPYDGTINNYFEVAIGRWLRDLFVHPDIDRQGMSVVEYASPRTWHTEEKDNLVWIYMTGDPQHQNEAFISDYPNVPHHLINTWHSGWMDGAYRRQTLDIINNNLN